MKIEYISQPFPPKEKWLGYQLRSLLTGEYGPFDRFVAIVAFVKLSGVSRISSALDTFRRSGAEVVVAAGINHGGTSKQGLRSLQSVSDRVFVYHDRAPQHRTFHPKAYIFEQKNKRAVVILGSGNMTAGGLFTNYEAHVRIELDLADDLRFESDKAFFTEIMSNCTAFQDPSSGCVQELSDDVLAVIEAALPNETWAETKDDSGTGSEDEASQSTDSETTQASTAAASNFLDRRDLRQRRHRIKRCRKKMQARQDPHPR